MRISGRGGIAALIAAMTGVAAQGAMLSGTVVLQNSRSASVNRHSDYSGVVVSAVAIGATAPRDFAPRHAVIRQKSKTFSPHILPVEVGTQVDFPNFDPIFHNAFSNYNGQIFDIGLYPPGSSRSVRFSRPGVVRVFCNIHPTMSAIILVLPTSHFTMTRPDGSFALDLPSGDYQMNFFHERATEQTLAALSRRITVNGEPLRLPPVAISEAGYLPAAHMNKYGRNYGPPPDDQTYYPGARK
ncbi:MAG: hypothetical protein KGN84_23040 [Acidobacteriota bacterium]|nr:hypothetical protein [Acidobacteriota bacterium]